MLFTPAPQVAGGVDTGVERLGLARPQEQLDDQTRRFREQVRLRNGVWGKVGFRVLGVLVWMSYIGST